jgi:hypothetical protein
MTAGVLIHIRYYEYPRTVKRLPFEPTGSNCVRDLPNWPSVVPRACAAASTPPAAPASIRKWRLLIEEGRKAGHTFSQPDLIIATTAQHHGLTVVSRDTEEYITARVEVFNPWADALPTTYGAGPE